MAIKKIEIRPKGTGDYSDVLYPKTSADMVETTGGTTVQAEIDNFQAEIDNLKSSVSNGKNAIATAITGMGQSASGSDSFATLANKIKAISSDANATTAQVLSGRTFYQGGLKRTGNMPNRGAVVITPSTTNQAIAAGYHNGNGYVKGDPNLIPSNIKEGVSIFGVTGTHKIDISNGIPVTPGTNFSLFFFNADPAMPSTSYWNNPWSYEKKLGRAGNIRGTVRVYLRLKGGASYCYIHCRVKKNDEVIIEKSTNSTEKYWTIVTSINPGDRFKIEGYYSTSSSNTYSGELTVSISINENLSITEEY